MVTKLYGGAGGIRTLDLLHAMQALSLLSHSPKLVSILAPKPAFVKRGLVLGGKIAAEGLTGAGPWAQPSLTIDKELVAV